MPEPVACKPSLSRREKLVALVHFTEIVVEELYVLVVPPATMFELNATGEALTLEQLPASAVAGIPAMAAASTDMRYVKPRHIEVAQSCRS
jgi:hypothetical protein